MLEVKRIMNEMTFEEKCHILAGSHALYTLKMERYGIPQLAFSDGPHGIRR